MSTAFRRCIFVVPNLLTVALLLASPAGSSDPLDDVKRQREITAQQVEADVRDAIREVNDLARTNPQKAVARLRQLIDMLETDTALTTERRDTLKAMANGRIRFLENDSARRTTRGIDDANRSNRTSSQRNDDGALARGLQDVQSLRAAGRMAEANQLQSDLARRYPDSAAATASRIIGDRTDHVADARRYRSNSGNGFQGALDSVDRSSVPEAGDYVLPPDWKTRVAKRSAGPKLTEQEKATLKALSTPIKAELKNTLSDVLEYLQQVSGVTIIADKKTLETAGATYDMIITTHFKSASLRIVLKKVLADINLTYIVKDGIIQVVTPEEARNSMTVRSYYVGDLAGMVDVRISPLLRDIQMKAAIGQIIDSITGSIEPNSWDVHGAQNGGTITYDPITMSLIIKQTAEVHYMLSGASR